jgi:hypothetical protein
VGNIPGKEKRIKKEAEQFNGMLSTLTSMFCLAQTKPVPPRWNFRTQEIAGANTFPGQSFLALFAAELPGNLLRISSPPAKRTMSGTAILPPFLEWPTGYTWPRPSVFINPGDE